MGFFESGGDIAFTLATGVFAPPRVRGQTPCLTWSMGFSLPERWANGSRVFLDYLREEWPPQGHYADPGGEPARHPGAIPPRILEHAARTLGHIRWTPSMVREFAGRYLTEPKAHVFFDPPARPLAPARFALAAKRRGIALDARSRFAFSGTIFFMNGEAQTLEAAARPAAMGLADRRRVEAGCAAPDSFWQAAHGWYLQGFVVLEGEQT